MNHTIITYLASLCLLVTHVHGLAQEKPIRGRVVDTLGTPIEGANIKSDRSKSLAKTDSKGYFRINVTESDSILHFSYLGLQSKTMEIRDWMDVQLEMESKEMDEVVVNTGYQQLPRERATGSFVHVNEDLINRSVSTDVISRLADVVPGLTFNTVGTSPNNQTNISIRGQSTINANTTPLIVIDNYPYEGDVNNLNPNDVESISILKDAAAASIWGARAGNGVIVITTKKGSFQSPTKVTFNSNVNIGEKPNVFYPSRMSTEDYIEMEKTLFGRGYYNSQINNVNRPALSPVVELLLAQRNGLLDSATTSQQIETFKAFDIRDDIYKYLRQTSINQQYALSFSGGGTSSRYFISGGYDHNRENQVGNDYRRVTLTMNHTGKALNDRLEVNTQIYFVSSNANANALTNADLNLTSTRPVYYYARLADDLGNPLNVNRYYSNSFLQEKQDIGLLPWDYSPLVELGERDRRTNETDYRINIGTKYKIFPFLDVNLMYQYQKTTTKLHHLQNENTWYTRDQINRLTVEGASGLVRPIPLGGILDLRNGDIQGHNGRFQLDLNKNWEENHSVSAIVGSEIRSLEGSVNYGRYYGYDDENGTHVPVDYVNGYQSSINPASRNNRIPNVDFISGTVDRFVSYYMNGAYTFRKIYTLSVSSRLDQSNLFGVDANQRGVPLYSVGASWLLSDEVFYGVEWLPYIRLRTTYGYNGNIDKSVSAYTTAQYITNSAIGTPWAAITNPPNADLRWERIRTINLGLDFATKNNRISGSLEYFAKKGLDLIGSTPYAPQTGVSTFHGNYASTSGSGFDISISSLNTNGKVKWTSDFFVSYVYDKVTEYLLPSTVTGGNLIAGTTSYPIEGRPLYAMYSYEWAGLDPETGNPMGYLDGVPSTDYTRIIAAITTDNINLHGSRRPLYFGALRNTLTYGAISLSANISYRLGYFFRRESIDYSAVLAGNGGHGDFAKRWMQPGDELTTDIPSLPASNNSQRNSFYAYSSSLVEKGDIIRLQDVTLSYDMPRQLFRNLAKIRFHVYANNLATLWKATSAEQDPQYRSEIPPRTIAFGINAQF